MEYSPTTNGLAWADAGGLLAEGACGTDVDWFPCAQALLAKAAAIASVQRNLVGNFKHGSCIRILHPSKLCCRVHESMASAVGILSSDSHRLIRKGRGEGSFQQAPSAGKAETLFVPGKFPSISDGAPVSGDAAGKNG